MTSNVVPLPKKSDAPIRDRSDDELMLLSSAGSRQAFETLVRRYASRIVSLCSKQIGNRALGEEMAQEVWLAVWDHRGQYKPEGKFVVWLITVTRNRIRNKKRDTVRRLAIARPADDSSEIKVAPDLSPSELDRLVEEERIRRTNAALAHVKEPLREAILLRFGQELSYTDIAEALQTNESTVRSRVFHGLRELRYALRGGE